MAGHSVITIATLAVLLIRRGSGAITLHQGHQTGEPQSRILPDVKLNVQHLAEKKVQARLTS